MSHEHQSRHVGEPVQLDQNISFKQKLVIKEYEKMCLEKIQEHKREQEEIKQQQIAKLKQKEEQKAKAL